MYICADYIFFFFFFLGYGDHRVLHVLTHSFPTRRSSDLGSARFVTLNVFGAYPFRIRNPVIASGAKQSRAVCAHSGLLPPAFAGVAMTKSRRLTDAKGIIANLIRGPAQRRPKSGTPDQVRGDGEEESPRRGLASRVAAGKQRGMTRLRLLLAALFALALGIAGDRKSTRLHSSHECASRM